MLCAYLIGSLDENGYLDESVQTIAAQLDCDFQDVIAALELLQSFEPAGVGAQNVAECLLLQLCRLPDTHLAQGIVRKHLKNLGLERYSSIAKAEQVSVDEVRVACSVIRGLSPYPGSAFSSGRKTEYVFPELAVTEKNGMLTLQELRGTSPVVRVSAYYQRLMDTSVETEVIEYLKKKYSQATELVRSIEQRRATLRACAEQIVEIQQAFFRSGEALQPMTQEQIASRLGIHKSTVSRAIREKYIKCDHGTFLISSLFSRAIKGKAGGISPDKAKRGIMELVRSEDPAHPLSDQKLTEELVRQGIPVSRRTVAKYRDELHILSSVYRKKNEK